jgi:hypothetical protein
MLVQFSIRALEGDSLQDLMDATVAMAATIPGVLRTGIWECVDRGKGSLLRTGRGWPEGATGKLVRASSPNGAADPRADGSSGAIPSVATSRDGSPGPEACIHDDGALLRVCIPGREAPFGCLELALEEARILDPEDRVFLESLARLLGSTIAARWTTAEATQKEFLARLEDLASNVAHEVRNPLAGFQGVLGVLGARSDLDGFERDLIKRTQGRIAELAERLSWLLAHQRT